MDNTFACSAGGPAFDPSLILFLLSGNRSGYFRNINCSLTMKAFCYNLSFDSSLVGLNN